MGLRSEVGVGWGLGDWGRKVRAGGVEIGGVGVNGVWVVGVKVGVRGWRKLRSEGVGIERGGAGEGGPYGIWSRRGWVGD